MNWSWPVSACVRGHLPRHPPDEASVTPGILSGAVGLAGRFAPRCALSRPDTLSGATSPVVHDTGTLRALSKSYVNVSCHLPPDVGLIGIHRVHFRSWQKNQEVRADGQGTV